MKTCVIGKLVVGALAAALVTIAHAQSFTNYNGVCPDSFSTAAAFKVIYLGTVPGAQPTTITVPGLQDTNTVVGRSNAFRESDETNAPMATINCRTNYPGTGATVGDQNCRLPSGFPEDVGTRREVHTEILSLQLTNDGRDITIERHGMAPMQMSFPAGVITIRAGQPYSDSVSNGPASKYFKNSIGEVASLAAVPTTNFDNDFPAASFFHVFVEVSVNLSNVLVTKLYNKTPMVLACQKITQFPPNVNLPTSTYIHDPTFGAVSLYDTNGVLVAYLLSAGHGADTNVSTLSPDAPLLTTCPVSFCVGTACYVTNSVAPTNQPNQAAADSALSDRPLRLYLSSSTGTPPDTTNLRQLQPAVSSGFVAGDAIKSFSFGRDGTGNPFDPRCFTNNTVPGTFYFSVSCSSVGVACTDVNLQAGAGEAAADLYVSGAPPFGRYTNAPSFQVRSSDNLLAVDQMQLGLAPGDNVTGIQLKQLNAGTNHDFLYLTLAGPSFTNKSANIYLYDSAGGGLATNALTNFASAASMGLRTNDVIDALVLSDITPGACPQRPNRTVDPGTNGAVEFDEVLFSLAPGSPTLTASNYSAADVLYSTFDGHCRLWASAASLGLLSTDDLDALAVAPAMPMSLSLSLNPSSPVVGAGTAATITGIPYGLPPFTYQWLSNGVPIPNATNATYTTAANTTANNGDNYTLFASNPYTNSSASAPLSVVGNCPSLSARLISGQVILQWPAPSPCTLEQSPTVPAAWSPLPGPYPISNGMYRVTISPLSNAMFFRLRS
jgi:hypothetical protein